MNKNALAFCILSFLSCISCTDDKIGLLPIDAPVSPVLKGEISEGRSVTLTPFPDSMPYKLRGYLRVKSGAVLNIQPGTKIEAESADDTGQVAAIVVEQGGQLLVNGTAASPVVFTCAEKKRGMWGGIVLLGKAPVNSNGVPRMDASLGIYGGTLADDNSGDLNYAVVEYAGYKKNNLADFGGLNLLGVGRGTHIDQVFVRESGDDGVKIFGGTVDLTHLLVKDCADDLFDWTEGWQGRGQFWIGQFCNVDPATHGRGIEAQSFSSDPGAVIKNPVRESRAKLYNVTLIGDSEDGDKTAVQVKSGWFNLHNSVIVDYDLGAIQIDTCGVKNSIRLAGMLLYDNRISPAPIFVKNCRSYPTLFGFSLIHNYPLTDLSDCGRPDYRLQDEFAGSPFSQIVVDPATAEAGGPDQGFFKRALFLGGDDGTNWAAWTHRYN
jgi:hypothetical protein